MFARLNHTDKSSFKVKTLPPRGLLDQGSVIPREAKEAKFYLGILDPSTAAVEALLLKLLSGDQLVARVPWIAIC